MVDVPLESLGGIAIAVITVFGTILIFMAKAVRSDFKAFSEKIGTFQDNLAETNLVVAKLLLMHDACPMCPKLNIDLKEGLRLIKMGLTRDRKED